MAGNENSGRKTKGEEIREYINTELANKIANKELQRIEKSEEVKLDEMRVIVMPIVTKNIVQKTDITTQGEKIIDNAKIVELANQLNEIHRGRSKSSDGVAADSMDREICDKE